MPRIRDAQGFSLIELGVVLVLIGLMLGIAVPGVVRSTRSSRLRVGVDGLAMQINLAREKSVDTQADLILRFVQDSLDSDFHVRDSGGGVSGKWSLPPQIQYAPASARGVTMTRDGRASASVYVLLMDSQARVDTISIQMSGMVLVQ